MYGQTIRLEDEPVGKLGFTLCDPGYRDDRDCGRWYLDIKNTKRALGIYKNRYACVL